MTLIALLPITLSNTLHVLSTDSPIVSASSSPHNHNKIVIFSDPVSVIIPANSNNEKKLHSLISLTQTQ